MIKPRKMGGMHRNVSLENWIEGTAWKIGMVVGGIILKLMFEKCDVNCGLDSSGSG
jgi:hypothetical protein